MTDCLFECLTHGPGSDCTDPAAAVPEAEDGRVAIALALAKAADADACFDQPYVDDGSTSDAEDRDYWLRLADAALAAVPARDDERERLADRLEVIVATIGCPYLTEREDGDLLRPWCERVAAALAAAPLPEGQDG